MLKKNKKPEEIENEIVCPRCGILSMDDVELSELGQTLLGAVFFAGFE